MTHAAILAGAIAAALMLTGCVPATSIERSGAPGPESSSSPTLPGQSAGTGLPSDEGTVIPVPEAGADTQAAAVTVAESVITAFGQPTLAPAEWLEQLTPWLSPTGFEAYAGTDPAQIPVTRVTGGGSVLPASTDVSLIVQVPTDAGPYNVTLTRQNSTAAWLAERIRPAAG